MYVWLSKDKPSVSMQSGVVRAEDWRHVCELVTACQTLMREAAAIRMRAAEEAALIRSSAIEEAAEIRANNMKQAFSLREKALADAESIREKARQTGYEAGLAQWHRDQQTIARDTAAQLEALRPRLARWIIEALEKVFRIQDSNAFFQRALDELGHMPASRYAVLRVASKDAEAARMEVKAFADMLGGAEGTEAALEVIAQDGLPEGSCILETDAGTLDLSLAVQLNALRTCVAQWVQQDCV